MKKIVSLLTAAVILLCGCDQGETRLDVTGENKIETVFSDENVISYDFDSDGNICFLTFGETGEFEEYEFAGEEPVRVPIYGLNFTRVGQNGERAAFSLDEENGPADFCADGDLLYYPVYVYENHAESLALFRYSLKDNKKEKLYTYRNFERIKKIALAENKIFTLGIDSSKFGDGETGDDYYNSGEVLICFDSETKTEVAIWETGVIDFGISENQLVIYAHDSDGYFFVTYDVMTGDYSEKIRCDLGMIYAFAMCGSDRYLYVGNETFSNDSCATMGSLNEEGKLDIVLGEGKFAGNVKYENGKICYIDSSPQSETFGRLICADISSALQTDLSKFLKLASAVHLSQAPSSLGFALIGERLDSEEFALAVLSQDRECDLFLFDSQEEFSYNVKKKGSFCPLNDVDGVEEYLNNCFPFLREAMTDENGNIWALPIAIRADTICYNEVVSDQYSLNFSEDMTPKEFLSAIANAKSNGLTYSVSPNLYSDLLIRDYLSRNDSFDTPAFRELAEWIKTELFKNEGIFSSGNINAAYANGNIGAIDFDLIGYSSDFARYSQLSSNRLVRIPNFSEKNEVICTFLCVNPFSENLEEALNYISLLARTLHDDEKNLCVSTASVYGSSAFYSELKSVLDEGRITFCCPNEVYAVSFGNYLSVNITLDEFISEADRKLSAYLNE